MSEYETQEKIDSLLENYFFFIESKSMNTDEKYSLAEKYLYQEKNQEDILLYEKYNEELTQSNVSIRENDERENRKRKMSLTQLFTKKKKINVGMNVDVKLPERDVSPLSFRS